MCCRVVFRVLFLSVSDYCVRLYWSGTVARWHGTVARVTGWYGPHSMEPVLWQEQSPDVTQAG